MSKTTLDHFLQLRLQKHIVNEIDEVIGTVPDLSGFNRCRFIRYAVAFALASITAEQGGDHVRN
jgi:hypothetical protein